MSAVIHFKNFMGPGALCGSETAGDAITPRPDQVTCEKCLALMGRRVPEKKPVKP